MTTTEVAATVPDNKVYVGKIGTATSEEALKAHFGAAGSITELALITSKVRPEVRFAYVLYGDAAQAQKAIAELNGKELDGAALVVETPRPQRPPRQPRQPREPREPRAEGEAADRPPRARRRRPADGGEENGESAPARRRRPRKPRTSVAAEGAAPAQGEAAGAAAAAPSVHAVDGEKAHARPRRPRRPRQPRAAEGAEGEAVPRTRGPRRPRPTKEEIEARPDSTQDLFVASLAFAVTDEELLDAFKGYGAISAKIATFRGRSKGFGFVHFGDSASVDKAIAGMNEKEIKGRVIAAKRAKVQPPREAAPHTTA